MIRVGTRVRASGVGMAVPRAAASASAVNTTPATHTKEYVKSRLGSMGAVPGHVALGGNVASSGVVFSSNV